LLKHLIGGIGTLYEEEKCGRKGGKRAEFYGTRHGLTKGMETWRWEILRQGSLEKEQVSSHRTVGKPRLKQVGLIRVENARGRREIKIGREVIVSNSQKDSSFREILEIVPRKSDVLGEAENVSSRFQNRGSLH